MPGTVQSPGWPKASPFLPPSLPESLHVLWLACSCCPGPAAIRELKASVLGAAQGRPGARPRPLLPATVCSALAPPLASSWHPTGHFLLWMEGDALGGWGRLGRHTGSLFPPHRLAQLARCFRENARMKAGKPERLPGQPRDPQLLFLPPNLGRRAGGKPS